MLAEVTRQTAQRGLSIVELMVGITIGLIIMATGSLMMVRQIHEHSRLSLEIQLQQDLRAAADLMLRDLRRAGFWATPELQVWAPGASAVSANPYGVTAGCNAVSGPGQVVYAYWKPDPDKPAAPRVAQIDSNEYFGFRVKDGTLYFLHGCGGGWQPLTDPNVLTVQAFSVTPTVQAINLADYCDKPCVDASACPIQQIRRFDISLTARAVFDSQVVRTIEISSHPRNDLISGACPA
ncbi:MAG TPA: prepilin-type N-terminal cleavage/methylation domain-containing protein [Burkholderiaceae bacterium]|jgi:type IV pilus assembly protein PilW